MSLLRKLEMAVDFSTSEKLIATYILKNGPDVLNMSTSQLAKATYTSPAFVENLNMKDIMILKLHYRLSYNIRLIEIVKQIRIFLLKKEIRSIQSNTALQH